MNSLYLILLLRDGIYSLKLKNIPLFDIFFLEEKW
jgi:hypothetical protein